MLNLRWPVGPVDMATLNVRLAVGQHVLHVCSFRFELHEDPCAGIRR